MLLAYRPAMTTERSPVLSLLPLMDLAMLGAIMATTIPSIVITSNSSMMVNPRTPDERLHFARQ
jgi:hypothetical protein